MNPARQMASEESLSVRPGISNLHVRLRRKVSHLVRRQLARRRHISKHRWPDHVETLHLREVERRFGLVCQDELDERVLAFSDLGECRRDAALVAHRRRRHGAQRFPARATRPVAWPHLHIVVDAVQLTGRRVQATGRRLHDTLHSHSGLQQIGTSKVIDEDEVTRHESDGDRHAGALVCHHECEMFRCVARCMPDPKFDVAYAEPVPIPEHDGVSGIGHGPLVLPLVVSLIREVHAEILNSSGQFAHSGKEIRVNMRLRRGDQA